MSSLFRLPIPGELLWSAVSRFHARFPSVGPRVISDLLLGHPDKCIARLFPHHLEELTTRLHHIAKPNAEEIMVNHTMFPFSTPFLEPGLARRTKPAARGNGLRNPQRINLHYLAIGTPREAAMRCCPQCIANDIQKIGAAAWRCVHQVGPLKYCPEHHCSLQRTKVYGWGRRYISLTEALTDCDYDTLQPPSELQLALARNVTDLATNPHWEVGPQRLLEACRIELRRSGRAILGEAALATFVAELVETFGDEELRFCNAPVGDGKLDWPAAIFLNRRKTVRIQHFIVICALLGISLKDLIAKAVLLSEPEEGPWPCISLNRPCSGKETIYRMRWDPRTKKQPKERYRFQCPHCRTVYFRPAPLTRRPDGSFEYELHKAEVPSWAVPLRDIWWDPSQNWRSLVARFGRSQKSIAVAAAKLGLPDVKKRSLKCYRKRASQVADRKTAKIEARRAVVLKFIKDNPTVTANAAPSEILRAYTWLRLNDPRELPSFASAGARKCKRYGPLGLAPRDAEIAEIILPILDDAELELKRPGMGRVGVTTLLHFLAPTIKIAPQVLKRMPKTSALIYSLVETQEQKRSRRITQIVNAIEQTQALPNWNTIYVRYQVSQMRPAERAMVRSAYLKRGSIRACLRN
jgi:hypothetical protein